MRAWVAIGLLLLGCSAREGAAWVPRLVVRGRVVQRVGADDREWDWQVHAGARWSAAPVARVEPGGRARSRPIIEPARCTEALLCAWERRARERAYAEALRELEGEGP